MPAADDFDAFEDQSTAAQPPAADTDNDPWGFNEQPAPKKEPAAKKKKKSKKDARKVRQEDGEDSSAYPKSITPSPPTDHGVKLRPPSPPRPPPPPEPIVPNSPLVDLNDDDTTAVEDVDLGPPPPSKPIYKPSLPSAVSPKMASPKPAAARPVPSVSPPSRPASLHGVAPRDRNNSLTGFRPTIPASQHLQTRRESITSQRPRFVEPPPPHMPQAHYFGLPNLGFGLSQKQESGRPAGSDGYCCRIDSLADAGDDASAKKARDALLVGCEGGLEVFRILPNKLEVVGRLEGLRGSVVDAKVLPHVERYDQVQALRPFVAVIVHGLFVDDRMDSGPEGEEREPGQNDSSKQYQTTVEVYSLKTSHHIATLYKSSQVAVDQPLVGQVSSLPDPVGDLHLDAKGEYIILSSGKSGEVFVFTQSPFTDIEETRFRCIGKFWTAVQKPLYTAARPASASESATAAATAKEEPRKAIHSLSHRWLAIAPPLSSPSISIQGSPLTSEINPSPPGISTHAAPPQPVITCEVVGTDVEGAWSRLGRQAAQGLVKYSQKGIEMGLQGWKELTQPSPPGTRPGHDRSASKDDLFPPTKAPSDDPCRLAREPALVSLIDLDSLKYWEEYRPKHPAPPMATLALEEGCSFLSLSTAGTRLISVSRKGEMSTIWDLAQVAHGIAARGSPVDDVATNSQCIKQLQRIARNSPSTVLECIWSKDDDAVAILTANGTVHLHEVPSRPPSRKRKRAATLTTPVVEKADATVSLQSGVSPPSANGGFLGSIKSSWQSVSTQVNSIRSTNPATAFGLPTTFAGFRDATAAAGNAGGRAVARGFSQGFTAAKGVASDSWHADDNKIRHTKALQEPFSAKSLRWIRRNNTTSVAIACGGSVHIHPVQRATRRKGDAIVTGLKHERYAQKSFPLPPIATRSDKVSNDSCLGQGPHGFWSLRHSSPTIVSSNKQTWPMTNLPQASDVETNPPFCPFHVDSRVNICAFDESNSQYGPPTAFDQFQMKGHELDEEVPWVFGEPLPPSTKINEAMPDEEPFDADDDDDEEDGGLASQMESKLTIQPARRSQGQGEQIRINTRRKQRGGGHGGGDEGEFFEVMDDDDGDSMM